MKVYFVRHGDKERGNFYNTYLRHNDEPLSETGNERSKKLCGYFDNIKIDKIYVSEYQRTEQTAKFVSEHKELNLLRDSRVNEIDSGLIEGMSDNEIKSKFPQFYMDFFNYSKDVRFPEGETGEEVKDRQIAFLTELIIDGQDSLVFSHEGFMRLMVCNLLGLPTYKRYLFKIEFCGIVEIEYFSEKNIWKLNKVNQTV